MRELTLLDKLSSVFLGHAIEFVKEPLEFLAEISRDNDFAPFRLGPYQCFFITKAEDVQEVLVKQADNFVRDPVMRLAAKPFVGNSILNSEGDLHRDQRKMMQPAFHHKRLDTYLTKMVQYTQEMLQEWEKKGEVVINGEIVAVVLKILCDVLFKADITDDVNNVAQAALLFEEVVAVEQVQPLPLPNWVPIERKRRLKKGVKMLRDVVDKMIRERRASGRDEGDVLSTLVFAKYEDGTPIPDDLLLDEMATMVLAGHETSASVITWMIYLLEAHPEIGQKVYEEVDRVLEGRTIEVSDLPKLVYLDAMMKETLRMYDPAWLFGRIATQDVTIGGHEIKKGQILFMSPYISHRQARYFEDPEVYRPERWLDGLEARLPKGSYIPFSNGLHVCIGQPFALMEIKTIMACLVQRHRFVYIGDEPANPVAQVTLKVDRDIPVRVVERTPETIPA